MNSADEESDESSDKEQEPDLDSMDEATRREYLEK